VKGHPEEEVVAVIDSPAQADETWLLAVDDPWSRR
jgi:hypothetical protein